MSWKRSLRIGALGAALLLAATGCAGRPTTAFSVNGQITSAAQFTDSLHKCADVLGMDAGNIKSDIFAFMLETAVYNEVSSDLGVNYSEAEKLSQLNNTNAAAMANDTTCRQVGMGAIAFQMMMLQAGSDTVSEAIADLEISVNPRYGSWNAAAQAIGEGGSLSVQDQS